MTTYTASLWTKVGREWKRCYRTFEATVQPTPEEIYNMIDHTPGQHDVHNVQLEEGAPATVYTVRKHKGKNTNSWKPRRYGK